jgi:hypothetical protein
MKDTIKKAFEYAIDNNIDFYFSTVDDLFYTYGDYSEVCCLDFRNSLMRNESKYDIRQRIKSEDDRDGMQGVIIGRIDLFYFNKDTQFTITNKEICIGNIKLCFKEDVFK